MVIILRLFCLPMLLLLMFEEDDDNADGDVFISIVGKFPLLRHLY